MSLIRQLYPEMRQMLIQVEDLIPMHRNRIWDLIREGSFLPAADVQETPDKYIIETEMPGVKKEDIKFDLKDENTIGIRAEVRAENKGKDSKRRGERYFGVFERAFTIPTKIEPDKVNADLKNGVLTLEIPKQHQEHEKPLEISWKSDQ